MFEIKMTKFVKVGAIASILAFGGLTAGVGNAAVLSPALQKADAGRIERIYVESPQLQDSIVVDVWLPEGLGIDQNQRYPVLYMHDGQNLYDASTTWNGQSWEMDATASQLIKGGVVPPFIIVGIHSDPEKRVAQLMPEQAVKDAGLDELMAEVKLITGLGKQRHY